MHDSPMSVSVLVIAAYAGALALLLPLALHRVHLLVMSFQRPPCPSPQRLSSPPRVTVQIPAFNEEHVIERVINAACRLDYPRGLLEIQVLDDSTDRTTGVARERACSWRRRGVDISVHHRRHREGFKAGALAAGLARASGDFILILDADFVPRRSLLQDLLVDMADPEIGMVQARWDHLNEEESWLTCAQALLLDGHFLVEQRGRARGRLFFNFNGTAGLWRREALEEAGGWSADTLTEDLDISYRAQMAGWRFHMRDDLGVAAELPSSPGALLVQQRRWAEGGTQTARKLLPRLLAGPFPTRVKVEACAHLGGHLAHPLTAALAQLVVPSALARQALALDHLWWLDAVVVLGATAPFLAFYAVAASRRGRGAGPSLWSAVRSMTLGAGLSLPLAPAALRGLVRRGGSFERTPKTGGSPSAGAGRAAPGRALLWSGAAAMLSWGVAACVAGAWASLPLVALFACGYLSLGLRMSRRPPRGVHHPRTAPEFGSQQQPNRTPDGHPGPDGLRPESGGSVP